MTKNDNSTGNAVEALKELRDDTFATLNYANFTMQFVEKRGVYFDRAHTWWLWDQKKFCWVLVDDIDIMNAVDCSGFEKNTLATQVKCMIIEGLKREGRKKMPLPLRKTQVQLRDKIVDFQTEEEIIASKEYFAVNPIEWKISESEDTPEIDKLFEEWVGKENKQQLYEIIAFCLSNDYFIQRVFCLIGSGCNGKSTFLRLIEKFIGKQNCCATELKTLLNSRFEKTRLYKKLVCMMGETDFNVLSETGLFKQLCGQDTIPFEFKHKSLFEDYNYAKIVISTNTLPVTTDRTAGFYRRWLIVDFPNSFSEGPDPLSRIPPQEYCNLARKSVNLLKKLSQSCSFTGEGTIKYRAEIYEAKSNPLTLFLKKHCDIDVNNKEPFFRFFDEYTAFLGSNGLRLQSKKEVSHLLKEAGYETRTMQSENRVSTWCWIMGLNLKVGTQTSPDNNANKKIQDAVNKLENWENCLSL